jgi:hypothetical protein
MAQSYTEGNYAAEFLIGECDEAYYSRDTGTLASGNNLLAGAVAAKIVTAGTATAQAGTNTGNGTMGAITVGSGAMLGAYTLKVTKAAANAGDFVVIDPQGDVIGNGSVAAAFNTGGLAFTLADGAADFVVGDTFIITVSALTVKWTVLNPTGTNGSQVAAGILYRDTDATSADTAAVFITRAATVDSSKLVWPGGATTAQKNTAIAQLAAAGIVVR